MTKHTHILFILFYFTTWIPSVCVYLCVCAEIVFVAWNELD